MDKKAFCDEFVKRIYAAYISKRPKSEKLDKEARKFMPGGHTRSATFYRPFATFMEYGEGCRLHDVDGNIYIDFTINWGSMIHGHAHPKLVDAVVRQVKRGTNFSAPTENQIKFSQILCDRLPSAEKVRFTTSGNEATYGAIRYARSFRKKYKVVKAEGGFHGTHDLAVVSYKPNLEKAGPVNKPNSVPVDIGIPPSALSDCIVIPYNNSEIAERIIEQNKDDLAAVILEPFQTSGGMIPADRDFLKAIREVTSKWKIPLIFDEVVSFRLAKGGCQEIYDVIPDVTTLGKAIGGGYPVGAIAGCEEFMDISSPFNPAFVANPGGGTWNGTLVTMAAGIAAMNVLTVSEIDRINKLGEKLKMEFKNALEEVGVIAQVTGMGSLLQIHFVNPEVKSWRDLISERADVPIMLHLLLVSRGIFPTPRCGFYISTPMSEEEITEAGIAVKSSLIELRPYIEKTAPELICR
jgi:glutamate-1-semialdehyde 2,1-aminomutase